MTAQTSAVAPDAGPSIATLRTMIETIQARTWPFPNAVRLHPLDLAELDALPDAPKIVAGWPSRILGVRVIFDPKAPRLPRARAQPPDPEKPKRRRAKVAP